MLEMQSRSANECAPSANEQPPDDPSLSVSHQSRRAFHIMCSCSYYVHYLSPGRSHPLPSIPDSARPRPAFRDSNTIRPTATLVTSLASRTVRGPPQHPCYWRFRLSDPLISVMYTLGTVVAVHA